MDLSTIAPIEKEYDLQHPRTGEATGLILTLACGHDDRVQKAQRENNDAMLLKGKDATDKDAEEYEIGRWAAYIVGVKFTGDANWKGETPEYSVKLAKDICAKAAFREQVMFEVRRTKDFYTA